MSDGLVYHFFLFVIYFVTGILCALLFDAFRVWDGFKRPCMIISVVKDISFWLIVTAVMFAVCLKFYNGEIRFFMFVAMIIGSSIYFGTLSRIAIKIMAFLLNLIFKIITWLFVIPVRFVLRLVNKPFIIAFSFSKRSMLNMVRKLKFRLKVLLKFKK